MCAPDGVRLCGGTEDCPELGFEECPGVGCTPVSDRDTTADLAVGVCWPDVPDWVNRKCHACPDGDVCVHRGTDGLDCVPFSVCAALDELGAGQSCRYADKSAFDGDALPTPAGPCPGGAGDFSCGGDCGDCFIGLCTGRSPGRPFGLCVGTASNGLACSAPAGGAVSPPCSYFQYCAVFDADAADDPVARRFGVCMEKEECLGAAAVLPGGLRCIDEDGQEVTP